MTQSQRTAAIYAVGAVLVFDLVSALVSSGPGAASRLGVLVIPLFLAIGFGAGRFTGTWRDGLGVVVIAAIADALIWWILSLFGHGNAPAGSNAMLVVSAALVGFVINAVVGLIGSLFGAMLARARGDR
jgi:hypothetical protein